MQPHQQSEGGVQIQLQPCLPIHYSPRGGSACNLARHNQDRMSYSFDKDTLKPRIPDSVSISTRHCSSPCTVMTGHSSHTFSAGV